MTDIEKIIAEIERLKKELYKQQDVRFDGSPIPVYDTNAIDGMLKVLDEVKGFINSLPAEQTSEDLEYLAMSLEETIGTSHHSRETIISYLQQAANWQKEQDINKACKWLVDNANGSIYYDDTDNAFIDTDELVTNFKEAMEKEDK